MLLQKPRRTLARLTSDADAAGPVLCNSFPKSGTHLLLQALQTLPQTRYYGSFLASVPSIRFRLRSDASHQSHLGSIAAGEVIPMHLYHRSAYEDFATEKNASHFFIYRDLRDVVVSEAFYLATMAKWHRMSQSFRELPDTESRIELSIRGLAERYPMEYPDVATRFGFYAGWMQREDCLPIRFEDLRGENREATLQRIAEFDQRQRCLEYNVSAWKAEAIAAMDPKRSHTFRSGEKQGWRKHFSEKNKQAFDEVAGDLNRSLGYPQD